MFKSSVYKSYWPLRETLCILLPVPNYVASEAQHSTLKLNTAHTKQRVSTHTHYATLA